MYDEACLGEASDFSELAEYLGSYDNSSFIGCEDEESWKQAVLQEVPNLFSLGYDTSNVKTTQTHAYTNTQTRTHAHTQIHKHARMHTPPTHVHMHTYKHMPPTRTHTYYRVLSTCI